ncbi:hypothetical protein B0H15DRAFT_856214 [Mycena belliarum]|uniref:Uncharacterized protein n=1 Tax=Mycena belliarum TaxID=1033014 RepID=A0AAD6XMQ4_9AGAR|nr:hypothetical protein B0H15DRAFT_856214 [Mycena belliae]
MRLDPSFATRPLPLARALVPIPAPGAEALLGAISAVLDHSEAERRTDVGARGPRKRPDHSFATCKSSPLVPIRIPESREQNNQRGPSEAERRTTFKSEADEHAPMAVRSQSQPGVLQIQLLKGECVPGICSKSWLKFELNLMPVQVEVKGAVEQDTYRQLLYGIGLESGS